MILDYCKDVLLNANDLLSLDGANVFLSFFTLVWFLLKTLVYGILYILSFQWLGDFVEIPSVFKHHYMAILGGKNALLNLDNTSTVIFSEVRLNSKGVLTGLCNAFFLAIPVTVPQLIALRAFWLGEYRRAAYCCLGTIAGQSLFFGIVLFGFEWILIPFTRCEGLVLAVGLFLTCQYLNEMCSKPMDIIVLNRDPTKLAASFRLTFSLAWFETSCIFNYFGGMTVHGDLLQTSEGSNWYIISTLAYYLALIVGSLLWTGLLGLAMYHFRRFCLYDVWNKTSIYDIYERIHGGFILFIGVTVCHSLPYYGLDYMVSNPLGFVYADNALIDTQAKTFYNQNAIDIEELNLDTRVLNVMDDDETVLDVAPFDDEITETQERDGYEPTSFPPEVAWENRFEGRARVDEKAARKAFEAIFRRDIINFDQPLFFTPELGEEDIADDEVRYDMVDDTSSAVFRWENFYHTSGRIDDPDFEFETQTHHVFRDLYLGNPVYKALAKADMLTFLLGQPASANLNVKEEFDLSQRRYILQHYLDFLSHFKQANTSDDTFFATGVYNQQFKGTLYVVRQYNAVRLSFPDMDTEFDFLMQPTPYPDQPDTKPLTFDMPQYNRYHDQYQDYLHEELRPYISSPLWKRFRDNGNGAKRPLQNDLDNQSRFKKRNKTKLNKDKNKDKNKNKKSLATDDAAKKERKKAKKAKKAAKLSKAAKLRNQRKKRPEKPKKLTKAQQIKIAKIKQYKQRLNRAVGRKLRHMTSNDTRPYYIGWDSDKQKVLIKSPALSTGITPYLQPDEVKQFHFQAWPKWPDQNERLFLEQLNLPQFIVPDIEIKRVRSSFNYYDFKAQEDMKRFGTTDAEDALETVREKSQYRFNTELSLQAQKSFFKRMSNYDWYWRRFFVMESDDDEDLLKAQHLKIGFIIPPGLDGTAWPSMRDNRVWKDDAGRYYYP